MNFRDASLLLSGLFAGGGAAPQIEPRKAPAPPQAEAAPPKREAPTFDKLHLDAAELPEGWKLAPELACVSPEAATLLEPGRYDAAVTPAKRKDFQTITATGPAGAVTGSVLYFEYSAAVPTDVLEFLSALLFGHEGRPTREHPEQPLRVGNVLLVLSFPAGSPQPAWIAERLRRRFGVRVRHDAGELKPLLQQLAAAYEKQDSDAGLALLRDNAEKLANASLAAYFEGELSAMKQDWAAAEKGYARALELDATIDPLPDDGVAFAATDRRGVALLLLKKFEAATTTLRDAARMAAALGRTEDQGHSLYNVACALALLGKGDDAIATLAASFKLAADGKALAKDDHDLDSLREMPAFKKLME